MLFSSLLSVIPVVSLLLFVLFRRYWGYVTERRVASRFMTILIGALIVALLVAFAFNLQSEKASSLSSKKH
jgi:hypothetical protein